MINAQTEKIFGYGRGELLGQPIEMLMPERFCDVYSGQVRKFFIEPQARSVGSGLELFAMRKDGTEFPVNYLGPLETEEGLFLSSVISDISERKR